MISHPKARLLTNLPNGYIVSTVGPLTILTDNGQLATGYETMVFWRQIGDGSDQAIGYNMLDAQVNHEILCKKFGKYKPKASVLRRFCFFLRSITKNETEIDYSDWNELAGKTEEESVLQG